jgi:hypothetical protein
MARKTTLAILNRALNKCNEPEVTTFVGVTDGTRAYQIYNHLCEAQRFIYNSNKGKWRFAEALGTGTFGTGTNTYAVPADCNLEDLWSFRIANTLCKKPIEYLDQNRFENQYPYIDATLDTGWPDYFTKYNDVYQFNKYPGADQAGSYFYFRYWKYQGTLGTASTTSSVTTSTATPTFTTNILLPEQFEELLTDLGAMLQLDFEGDNQANFYRVKVFGGRQNDKEIRGGLNELKDMFNSVERTNAEVNIIL